MARLDEIKEQLSTLRVALTLIVVGFLTIGSALISVYNDSISEPPIPLNHLFFDGIVAEMIIFVSLCIIGWRITRRIKEIGDSNKTEK